MYDEPGSVKLLASTHSCCFAVPYVGEAMGLLDGKEKEAAGNLLARCCAHGGFFHCVVTSDSIAGLLRTCQVSCARRDLVALR